MEDLTPNLHYRTYLDNTNSYKPVVDIDLMASALPHGSGIDGDYYIEAKANGNINVTGEYHNMNENGFYCGWSTFRFSIVRASRDKYHDLIGHCAGQRQYTERKGDIVFRYRKGDDDTLTSIYFALRDAGVLPSPRNETVKVS